MRLIPIDSIKYYSITHDGVTFSFVALESEIEKIPVIESTTNLLGECEDFICYECEFCADSFDYNYCPNCGKMIIKENNIKE